MVFFSCFLSDCLCPRLRLVASVRGLAVELASSDSWKQGAMARNDCLTRVVAGVGVGGAVGGAVGAVYGTYDAFRQRIPGILKVRYIGQTTLGSAAVFGIFLGAGSLIQCGKNY